MPRRLGGGWGGGLLDSLRFLSSFGGDCGLRWRVDLSGIAMDMECGNALIFLELFVSHERIDM